MVAFTPDFANTKSISASSTSASATLAPPDVSFQIMRVVNAGTKAAFIRWGVGAQTALTTDLPVLGGTIELFAKGAADTVAAITSGADTTTIYISCGEGS